jgi:hypothetical protein
MRLVEILVYFFAKQITRIEVFPKTVRVKFSHFEVVADAGVVLAPMYQLIQN